MSTSCSTTSVSPDLGELIASGPVVMGVVNVTPDSFYPGSRVDNVSALTRARDMIASGAQIIDIGGESTRPGADPVSIDAELDRVLPVIDALADECLVSIDTRHIEVAREAVAAGASIINDITSSLHQVAADAGVGWVSMHMQGEPSTMQHAPRYDDVVGEVLAHLLSTAELGRQAGVEHIWLDPGIGFGKSEAHNLALIGALDRFVDTGYPIVLGVSRKSLIGAAHARSDRVESVPPEDRLEGSVALAAWGYLQGVAAVRAHDVLPTRQAAQIVAAPTPHHRK